MMNSKYASAAAAVFAASMLAVASSTAMAAIVCNTTTVPIAVPQDGTGIYLNLITGANGSSPPAGWDFNPYDRGLPGISFWFANDANKGALWDGTNISVLASGATIGPASLFTASVADPAADLWRAGSTGQYLGLRVFNEGTATMNFGWVQLNTGAAGGGFPATINSFCFQNDGTAITAGTTPVTLQNFSVD